uniref:Uncharacterized protein n=1 Tax=viral metagenome TaxID=1070528 RepID=A0A6C0H1X4_9ZZZZ
MIFMVRRFKKLTILRTAKCVQKRSNKNIFRSKKLIWGKEIKISQYSISNNDDGIVDEFHR